jgi:RNA recognition motif-containing protein
MAQAEYSVKVSGVSGRVKSDQVRRFFEDSGYNAITDVYLPPGKEFGFVRFASAEEAYSAADMQTFRLNGIEMGLEIAVSKKEKGRPGNSGSHGHGVHGPSFNVSSMASSRSPPRQSRRQSVQAAPPASKRSSSEFSIWIGNLPGDANTTELRYILQQHGVENMSDVYIPPGKNFGFARFLSIEEVEDAMAKCEGMTYEDNALELQSSGKKSKAASVRDTASGGHTYGPMDDRYGGSAYSVYWDGFDTGRGGCGGYFMEAAGKGAGKPGEYSIWVGNLPKGADSNELR